MKIAKIILGTVVVVFGVAICASAETEDRIYGKIITVDGDTFEGLIRWDKNEGSWADVLDGNKDRKDTRSKESRRKRYKSRDASIKIFGLEIGDKTTINWSSSSQSGMRFGHLRTLEATGSDEVLLTLKSGEEVELESGSTDFGDNIREIIIEDKNEGELELVWDDIDRIEFMKTPSGLESNFGERLAGTVYTRRGETFTGAICWDVDELFGTDILDGDLKGRRRKIKFDKIKSIARYSSNGATVVLKNGDEMLLKGTNDVDDGNRGITVSDPGFGQVKVDWDEFEKVEFQSGIKGLRYNDFDGGHRLTGTVYTEDGDSYSGKIRWDDDEEYSWEILDGEFRDIEFDVELGLVKEIKKRSYRSSMVTVWDGRTFRLSGSNDVDDDNKGIYVTASNGDETEISWEEFDRVEFDKK